MTERFKAYLLQFEPPGVELSEAFIERAMDESDFCMDAPGGLSIGQRLRVGPTLEDGKNGKSPPTNSRVRCIALMYHGKMAILETEES